MTIISSDQIKTYIITAVEARLGTAQDDLRRARMHQQRFPFDHDNNDFISKKQLEVTLGHAALHKAREL